MELRLFFFSILTLLFSAVAYSQTGAMEESTIQSAIRYMPIGLIFLLFVRQVLDNRPALVRPYSLKIHLDSQELHRFYFWLNKSKMRELISVKPVSEDFEGILASRIQRSDHFDEIFEYKLSGVSIFNLADFYSEIKGFRDLSHSPFMSNVLRTDRYQVYQRIKDLIEPFVALMLLLLISPIMITIAVLVRLDSKGKVIYSQERYGIHGAVFLIYKFRTMKENAELEGPRWSSEGDSRVTKIGGFLRRSHLDELPQLINIIMGQMSFIGPRPERPIFHNRIEKDLPVFKYRLLVKPGITGLAQIREGYSDSVDSSKIKLVNDLKYIRNRNIIFDTFIIFETIKVFFFPRKSDR